MDYDGFWWTCTCHALQMYCYHLFKSNCIEIFSLKSDSLHFLVADSVHSGLIFSSLLPFLLVGSKNLVVGLHNTFILVDFMGNFMCSNQMQKF